MIRFCPACVTGIVGRAGCDTCGLGAPHPIARLAPPPRGRHQSREKLDPKLVARRHAQTLARMGPVVCAECGATVPRTGTMQVRCPSCAYEHGKAVSRQRERRKRLERRLHISAATAGHSLPCNPDQVA